MANFQEAIFGVPLASRYFETLDDEIHKRSQHPRKKFKDNVLTLDTMMRDAQSSKEQRFKRIFRKCLADYLWYIKRRDFTTQVWWFNRAGLGAWGYKGTWRSAPGWDMVSNEITSHDTTHQAKVVQTASRRFAVSGHFARVPGPTKTSCRRCGEFGV